LWARFRRNKITHDPTPNKKVETAETEARLGLTGRARTDDRAIARRRHVMREGNTLE
jgi:hypothetical protein